MIKVRSALRRLRIRLLPVPGQALGLAVLVGVLAAALVSAPLMIASAEEGSWQAERQRLSETAVGTTLLSSSLAGRQVPGPDRVERAGELDDAVTEAADHAGLSAPVFLSRLRDPLLTPAYDDGVQLVHRTGAEDNVQIVAGELTTTGVVIPQALAEAAGVGPGGTIPLTNEAGVPISFPVSGVYLPPTDPLPTYWEDYSYLWLPRPDPITGDLIYPPAVMFGSRDVALAGTAQSREDVFLEWFLPLPAGSRVDEARAAADRAERLQAVMASPESAVTALVTDVGYERPTPRSTLPAALENVDGTVDLLSPPVQAVGVGGGAAALVLVGAWAGQRVRRREDELRSLVARGLSPLRGAADAARESTLPVLVGLAAGGAAGWLLVRELGPSPDFPPGTLGRSLVALAAAGVGALAVIGAVTAVLVARLDSVGSGQAAHLLRRIPWLPVTAAVAVLLAVPLVTGAADAGGRVGIDTLMVPLLVTVVVAGAVTAGLPLIGRRADTRLHRLPVGPFLAVRRVLAASGASRLVVLTTALTLGLVVYAGALADGTDRTIEAKASVASGSDVVVRLPQGSASDGELPPGAMVVGTEDKAQLVPGDGAANVLVVHPEQVADVVRWNDVLAEQPLDDLMTALSGYEGDRIPVLLSGPVPDEVAAAGDELTIDFTYYTLPVEVVGRTDAFPGQGSRDTLVVADWDRYVGALEANNRDAELVLSRQVWSRGEVAPVLGSLAAAGYAPRSVEDVSSAAEFTARPELNAQTWSLSYLRAVALAAGVLGLVGVVMHAVAQQRRRTVAALLLGRMGMRRRTANLSSGLEIGLLTGLAALVAVAVALPASALVLRLLDPVPSLRPGSVFGMPWASIAAVLAGVAVVTVCGAVLVGRSARRATGGQVMRDAT